MRPRELEFDGPFLVRCSGGPFDRLHSDVDTDSILSILGFTPDEAVALQLSKGLQIALMHYSYLYENSANAAGGVGGVLRMFEGLGLSWVERHLALWAYASVYSHKPGPVDEAIRMGKRNLYDWIDEVRWPIDHSSLGRGERLSPARSVGIQIFHQVAGLLSLLNADVHLRRLIHPAIDRQVQNPTGIDAKTLLDQFLRAPSSYEVSRTGPDHAPSFAAVVMDAHGRSASGTGPNRKVATQAAALEFLKTFAPAALANAQAPHKQPVQRGEPELRIPGGTTSDHLKVVREVLSLFSLDQTSAGRISQAFIHSSWSYENQSALNAAGQRDNRVLGRIGSAVLNFENALAVSRSVLEENHEEFRLLTPLSATFADAFDELGLARGMCRGRGEFMHALQVEAASNAFQALAAAVHISKGLPRSLMEIWPAKWQTVRDSVAPRSLQARALRDKVTLLQEYARALDFEYEFKSSARGPDHDPSYQAELVLKSAALGKKLTLREAEPARWLKQAKQNAAAPVIEVMRFLSGDPGSANSQYAASKALTTFVLALFLSSARLDRSNALAWRKQRLFGCQFGRDQKQLMEWARRVDAHDLPPFDSQQLTDFLRRAFAVEAGPTDAVASALRTILDWVDSLDNPEDVTAIAVDRVVLLCSIYRALSATDDPVPLSELMYDWQLLHRGKVSAAPADEDQTLAGVDAGLLEAIVNWGVKAGQVHVHSSEGLVSVDISGTGFANAAALWNGCSPRLTTNLKPDHLEVGLVVALHEKLGTVGKAAAAAALDHTPSPLAGVVASLLHDLKNQLSAAAQAASAKAVGRTAQLEQQLAASRHLDQAAALSSRLRAATQSLIPTDGAACDLGLTLRQYTQGAAVSLPHSIQLAVPAVPPEQVNVNIDAVALSAILDNLVKNAVEAMPAGGSIQFDWTSDDDVAVLEVADTGPGLPASVAAAVAGRGTVTSTKSGGNGLGLMSVRDLLRRFGGEISHVPSSKGTSWHLTLPRVNELPVGEPQ